MRSYPIRLQRLGTFFLCIALAVVVSVSENVTYRVGGLAITGAGSIEVRDCHVQHLADHCLLVESSAQVQHSTSQVRLRAPVPLLLLSYIVFVCRMELDLNAYHTSV